MLGRVLRGRRAGPLSVGTCCTAQFSRNQKAIIPVLRQARRGSHDTTRSLVARYFDCVVLPHAGGAALPRLRMKRRSQLRRAITARHRSLVPTEKPRPRGDKDGVLRSMRRGERRDVSFRELDLEQT
jgi:hypothetical protein